MREVMCAMPRAGSCRVCGRNISKGHKVYGLIDAESEPEHLNVWFAHPRCAREAGWLTHRDTANHPLYGDRSVMLFWGEAIERKAKRGIMDYVR